MKPSGTPLGTFHFRDIYQDVTIILHMAALPWNTPEHIGKVIIMTNDIMTVDTRTPPTPT